jgi:hypothetical protein
MLGHKNNSRLGNFALHDGSCLNPADAGQADIEKNHFRVQVSHPDDRLLSSLQFADDCGVTMK